jgi:hypothetical protein
MSNRLFARLRSLHARLDSEIAAERARRAVDTMRIARMKKLKLAIKDRLNALQLPKARLPA